MGDNFNITRNRVIILALCSTLHIYLIMFQVSINSIQKTSSYCQKNFNQNVDAARQTALPPSRHTDHRQSISRNFSLKSLAKNHQCIIHILVSHA